MERRSTGRTHIPSDTCHSASCSANRILRSPVYFHANRRTTIPSNKRFGRSCTKMFQDVGWDNPDLTNGRREVWTSCLLTFPVDWTKEKVYKILLGILEQLESRICYFIINFLNEFLKKTVAKSVTDGLKNPVGSATRSRSVELLLP